MANRQRGELRLVAGAVRYTLRLTIEACVHVEDRSGKDLDRLIRDANRGSVQALRWILWASLQARHSAAFVEPEAVGPVMDALETTAMVRARVSEFLDLNRDDRPAAEKKSAKSERAHDWNRLFIDARCLGLSAETFWRLSLKELWQELAVAEQQAKRQRDRDVTLAWMVGNFCSWRKLPPLEKLLSAGPKAMQTPRDQLAMMGQLSAQLGIPLQRIPYRKQESHGAR